MTTQFPGGFSNLGSVAGTTKVLADDGSSNGLCSLTQIVTYMTGLANTWASGQVFVAPVLGTPAAGTLTSCTGLPVATGVSGLGTGVATFLATPSSANLISAITDETGTGSLVFANTPLLQTPLVGNNGGTNGQITLYGSTSGTVALKVAAAAGTGTIFQLPATNGTSGYVLQTDGSGVTSWAATAAGSSLTLQYNNAGSIGGMSGTSWDDTNRSLTLTGATVTTSNPLLNMTQTWNGSGITFTGIKLNVTDTLSATASLFLDLQVAGTSKFSVSKAGNVLVNDIGTSIGYAGLTNSGGAWIASSGKLGFGGNLAAPFLQQEAATTLVQRNSTTAQKFIVYNTWTDASNYERGIFDWIGTSNTLTIGTEKLGTGSTRALQFMVGGTVSAKFDTTGNFVTSSGTATPAGGSTAARHLMGTTAAFGIYYGSGAPTVSAAQGSIYLRSDGSSTSTRLYVNSDGATTWTNVTTAA